MIVATLLEPHLAGLKEAVAACDGTADAYEIRLDALQEEADPHQMRQLTTKPLIATARKRIDGGRRDLSPERRHSLLRACLDAGFEYADIEVDEPSVGPNERLIRSQHDLRATPSSATLLRGAQDTPAESIYKFAATIRAFSDTLQLLIAARALQTQRRRYALMGLGDFPRPLTHLFGSTLIYGGGRTNAPGQPGHAEIAATLQHWANPQPSSKLLLVVGDPITQSLSPRMHNAALRQLHRDASYGALRVTNHTQLQMLLARATPLQLVGLSITTPLKDAAYELCQSHAPEAQAARAVNCIRFENGVPVGHNTDGAAAAQIAQRLVGTEARILILGTGGAGRALASQWPKEQVTLASRDPEKLRSIGRHLGCRTIPLSLAAGELHQHDLIVNASRVHEPVPLHDHEGPLFDFHYAAQPTPWQRHAQEHKAAFAGGLELLLEQGVRAFRLWTGEDPPVDVMRNALGSPA